MTEFRRSSFCLCIIIRRKLGVVLAVGILVYVHYLERYDSGHSILHVLEIKLIKLLCGFRTFKVVHTFVSFGGWG